MRYTDGKVLGSEEFIKLVSTYGGFLGNILVNVDGITLGLGVVTDRGYLYVSFDVSNDGNLDGLLIGGSLGSTDGEVLGSDEGIKLILSYGKVLGTILGNVYGITLGLGVGTYLVYLDGYFDGSNYGKL